jgi:hypothetical protein
LYLHFLLPVNAFLPHAPAEIVISSNQKSLEFSSAKDYYGVSHVRRMAKYLYFIREIEDVES